IPSAWTDRPFRRREPVSHPAARNHHAYTHFARPVASPRICDADGAAHADRARPVARVHLHLRDLGREEPPRGDTARTAAGYPPVGPDSWLHLGDRRVLPLAGAGTDRRR